MRQFDPWPVFFKREWRRNWPFLVGFAVTGVIITKISLGLTGNDLDFPLILSIAILIFFSFFLQKRMRRTPHSSRSTRGNSKKCFFFEFSMYVMYAVVWLMNVVWLIFAYHLGVVAWCVILIGFGIFGLEEVLRYLRILNWFNNWSYVKYRVVLESLNQEKVEGFDFVSWKMLELFGELFWYPKLLCACGW